MTYLLISVQFDNASKQALYKYYDVVKKRLVIKRSAPLKRTVWTSASMGGPASIMMMHPVKRRLVRCRENEYEIEANLRHLTGIADGNIGRVHKWGEDVKPQIMDSWKRKATMGRWFNENFEKIDASEKGAREIEPGKMDGVIDRGEFAESMKRWGRLLSQPVPDYKRCAFDIEVKTDGKSLPKMGENPIRCIAVAGSDSVGRQHVFTTEEGTEQDIKDGIIAHRVDSEKRMLSMFFDHIDKYPIWLTYNGDNFDLPYICERAQKLGIPSPLKKRNDTAFPERHIHIDLYGVFHNHALQIYAFGHKYHSFGLDDVSRAMLGRGKLEGGVMESDELLEEYCANDASLTLDLTTFDDSLVMNVLTMFSRISGLSIDDVSRTGISNWAKYMIYRHCYLSHLLIPSESDIPHADAVHRARTRDKKYEGASILETKPGVYFGATVMDFASLYPSIIEKYNISYDTVNCEHDECKSNTIPGTVHWSCTINQGTLSLLIGSLKHLRVDYYKKYRGEGMNRIIEQVLKVFLNASYGIVGFSGFPLYYLPVAESVTAVGRNVMQEVLAEAGRLGLNVIYGDTDSLFISGLPDEGDNPAKFDSLMKFAEGKFGLQFQVDKIFNMLALSSRKKNYFGVSNNGEIDIKGLSAKKNNMPQIAKDAAQRMIATLSECKSRDEIDAAIQGVKSEIGACIARIEKAEGSLEDFAFETMVGKEPKEYKSKPQAVKAGEMLGPVKKGDFVKFVKTRGGKAKPIQLATRDELDTDKYLGILETVCSQIIEPFGLSYEECKGQTTMDSFW